MKKIKSVFLAIRNLLRGRRFLLRTVVSLVLGFALAVGIIASIETIYYAVAANVGSVLFACLAASQIALYSKELGRVVATVKNMASTPAPAQAAAGQAKASREKKPMPARQSVGDQLKNVVDGFNLEGADPEDEEDDERFEDDDEDMI